MDVLSLYTKTDHEEGADACFKKLKERKKKSILSIVIKNLIFMILKSNAFRFSYEYYRQITGTTMGTLMTPNYANLFMDNFEQRDYSQKTGLSPLVWFRFCFLFFFCQGFLSRTLTTHRTAEEGRGPSYSTLPLPPAHEHSDIYLQLCT